MHIDQANLKNLTGLWKKYGARPLDGERLPSRHINMHWPYRCWVDSQNVEFNSTLQDQSNDIVWLENIPDTAVLPLCSMLSTFDTHDAGLTEKQFLSKKWSCAFEQTAMYMPLHNKTATPAPGCSGFRLMPVRTPEDIIKWVDIGSDAFAYIIERTVIEKLFKGKDKDVRMLLGWQDEQAVATALLYKTGDVIGLHQMGVKQAFQGQGIARSLLEEVIAMSVKWQGKHIVLQASQAGLPLYKNMGFKAQFIIKNYQKT